MSNNNLIEMQNNLNHKELKNIRLGNNKAE